MPYYVFMNQTNQNKIIYFKVKAVLGVIIILSSTLSIFLSIQYRVGLYVLIISTFALLALLMNYSWEGKDRNAWDVWFFSVPGIIASLFFIGILANDKGVWKWIIVALGGLGGFESLSSILKPPSKLPIKKENSVYMSTPRPTSSENH